jgi:transposase-like protein
MSGKRRKYTPEFREEAARLVIETGRPVAHVAAEIGVGEQVLGRWVRLQRQAAAAGDTGAVLYADERAELEHLRRENAELRLDREFLKKPRPSSSPKTTDSSLSGDRGGEGHPRGQADA